MVDYDNTLNDSDSKFIVKLDGVMGLPGGTLWEIYLKRVHREIVHARYPEKHDDAEFHCKLIFEYLGKPYDELAAKLLIKRYREAEEESWKNPAFFPDALPFLDGVKKRGYKLCLITGGHALEKAQSLEKRGSKAYFDHVFGEDTLGYRKTDVNYYWNALRLSGSKPAETVSVGDTLTHDIMPATSVGITTIWVNRKGESPQKNRKPDYEVRNLLEAFNYL